MTHDNGALVKLGGLRMSDHLANPCIVAATIFYRQTDDRLINLVYSLEDRCDGIVALDGPYAGLSTDLDSPASNYETIADHADICGLAWRVYAGQEWRGEPEKRTAAARMALDLAWEIHPEREPWVLVIDSDEWLLTDIDTDAVAKYGHGSGQMQSYRNGDPVNEGGSGSKMVRLIPNTPTLLWGPTHFDCRDGYRTYSGWEKALTNDDDPAFTIGHDLGTKVIQKEYEAYNDVHRVRVEGKMMRIVDDYQRGADHVKIRMDNEQIVVGKWKPGMVVQIGGTLLGLEDAGHVVVREVVPVEGYEHLISDIICELVDETEAERLSKIMVEADEAQTLLARELLAKRLKKRARKLDRERARYGR